MKIHEFQAKQILAKYGVAVLSGHAAKNGDEAVAAADAIGGSVWVVKAQIHAGGRGKGRFIGEVPDDAVAAASRGEDAPGPGGVRLARSLDDVRKHAEAMLGKTLVTKQTGREGRQVNTVYVESGCKIARELYLSVLLDRSWNRVLFLASGAGGMDIETVAAQHPELIHRVHVDPLVGLTGYQATGLALDLELEGAAVRSGAKFFQALYRAYMETDASMLEINPIVVTEEGEVLALDAKMSFDDNALYRHPEIGACRDLSEEEPAEIEASEHNLSFVKLDGNIGCLVNGAGLAMATMDVIKLKGAEPANFLDVGGGANQEQVTAAFRIITKDPHVKGILVNIFGGIMKCDVIANGVVAAVKETGLKVPLVVRLVGTNAEEGRKILKESGLNVIAATTLDEAANAVVAAI